MNESEWLQHAEPRDMLAFLRGQRRPRKLRLFACACCRRIWHLLEDERSRDAVIASERYADRLIRREELIASRQRAMLGKPLFDYYVYPAENAAASVARPTISHPWILWLTESALGNEAVRTRGGSTAAVNLPLREEVREAEARAQRAFLHDLFGNPFRPVSVSAAWRAPSVTALAQGAYEERSLPAGTLDPARLAVLADALEEGGCTDEAILGHLRGPGPHIRGCFPVDLILGKQ
jgi:hypothetical protein